MSWFDTSLEQAEKASNLQKRVGHLMEHLTYNCYLQVNRGLFEEDKMTYKLMLCLQIMKTEGEGSNTLTEDMANLLLRGGSALALDALPRKPFEWLQINAWQNICYVSQQLEFFGDLKQLIEQNEKEWKAYVEADAPEDMKIPRLEERFQNNQVGAFYKLLVQRCIRIDRFRSCSNNFIGAAMGKKYSDPVTVILEDVHADSISTTPIVVILTPGADPTADLEEVAKRKGIKIYAVSMGEGQEIHAKNAMKTSMDTGGWTLLQNCHLGLGFMGTIDDEIAMAKADNKIHPNFRIWITSEPNIDFPISLLQIAIKVTNEPPRGMKAGLLRSYSGMVDPKLVSSVETQQWRDMVFATCFMHSAVQERRKFGPIGWCIPYEYNNSDLEASLKFLEKHSFANVGLQWVTIQYMVAEVQYGGRITDDFDRLLFNTFAKFWLQQGIFDDTFTFAPKAVTGNFTYKIPRFEVHEEYLKFIQTFPDTDVPEIFGLNLNAELVYGIKEGQKILDTIIDTQPKESSGSGGGKTREDVVYEKCDELLKQLQGKGYNADHVLDKVKKRPKNEVHPLLTPKDGADGLSVPLTMFLYQEVTRMDATITLVRSTLLNLRKAIDGEIIMTPDLRDALNAVFDVKPPTRWFIDASGAEIAWRLPSLALWFSGLLARDQQLYSWLETDAYRPVSFWLTGFYNPQGFLTATRQEVTRIHKEQKWALDDVVVSTKMTDTFNAGKSKGKEKSEGVMIHGLYLEGAAWDKAGKFLKEAAPRMLFTELPILAVSALQSKDFNKLYNTPDYYSCPVYKTGRRAGLNYIFSVKLKTDKVSAEHWIFRGVAILCTKDA
jgi:dynein heavy chain